MGSISCLIVSPCISPALVGVLAYIAHTGNVWLGALSLLALGIGMGLPLLLLGASVGKFLPKAGAWMQTIEHLVGIMMLAFAIWLLSRIIPGPLALFLWSALLIVSATMMGDFKRAITNWQHLRHGLASIALVYGLILMLGAFLGNSDPLHPWENWQLNFSKSSEVNHSTYITINNMEQFNRKLTQAQQENKWVILDFYADWCESCVRMERYVFKQPRVLKALENFIWLRADITANNTFDQAIMKRFHVIAPPMLLFFAPNGKELINSRLVGETTAKELLTQLQNLEEPLRGH
jgi:thiol:disulfide interchange protein DsbD